MPSASCRGPLAFNPHPLFRRATPPFATPPPPARAQEMSLLQEVDRPGSEIDHYVERMTKLLEIKRQGIEDLQVRWGGGRRARMGGWWCGGSRKGRWRAVCEEGGRGPMTQGAAGAVWTVKWAGREGGRKGGEGKRGRGKGGG